MASSTVSPGTGYTTSGSFNSLTDIPSGSTGRSCEMPSTGFILLPFSASAISTSTMGAWIKRNISPAATEILGYYTPGTSAVCSLFSSSDGSMRFVRGNSDNTNVLVTAPAGSFMPSTWNHVEIIFTQNATTGSVSIYVNGSLVASGTGLNTGSSAYDRIAFFGAGSPGTIIDHVVLQDASNRLNKTYLDTFEPSSNSSVAWTPLSGNNYANVNEGGSDGDTTYVSSSTVSQKDEYNQSGITDSPANIYAVEAQYVGRKDDAGTRQVRSNVKSGSTTSNGTTNTMSSSYAMYRGGILTTDPNTSAAWTKTGVNAVKQQIEVIA